MPISSNTAGAGFEFLASSDSSHCHYGYEDVTYLLPIRYHAHMLKEYIIKYHGVGNYIN